MHGTKEKIYITTSDHWKIALFHYAPEKRKWRYPVFMVHGIASDHSIWDLRPGANNLAPFLAQAGFDVYTIDLRGRGESDGPQTGRGNNWSVDDYLLCDLPAAVDTVLEDSGADRLHWVGHSMGGFLPYYFQIRNGNAKLQSHTAIASAMTYTFSTINMFRNYVDYFTFLPYLPVGMLWKLSAPFAHLNLPWNRFLFNPENMHAEDARHMASQGLGNIGIFEWNQLKTVSTSEGMLRITGGKAQTIDDPRIKTPVLLLAGDKDAVCPLDGVNWTKRKLKIKAGLKVFGPDYGHETHYGHLDMVLGKNAPVEVWPHLLNWLEDRDRLDSGADK